MARRKSMKIQPSVEKLIFKPSVVPVASAGPGIVPGSAIYYFDLSQTASLLNRRFYRQGLNWAVSGIRMITKAVDPNTDVEYPGSQFGQVTVSKLPNTWVMSNSWEKGFRAWKRQQDDALEEGQQESVRAKYNDFKIFMDADHLASGFANNELPIDSEGNEAAVGEWQASQIVIPNFGAAGVNYEPFIQAVGDDVGGAGGSISLIKAYSDSRGVPQSPDPSVPAGVTSSDNIYRAMFDTGMNMEDVMENVVGKNDELPYPQDDYPGGDTQLSGLQIMSRELLTGTTVGNQTFLNGGSVPCGLLKIELLNYDGVFAMQPEFHIDLVPGSHRGYLCEPMTEM